MNSELETFKALFDGRKDAVGLSIGGVERRELTDKDYAKHLAGESAIGVFPMRDDNTVMFAAIDLDEPNFDLARDIQSLIPFHTFVERSRSGNAHIWLFFTEPCPAWAIRAELKAVLESVGRPEVEVFPKQDQLKTGMIGNYINLPWFGEERPFISLISDEVYTRSQWLDMANISRIEPSRVVRRAEARGAVAPEFRPDPSEFGTREQLHMCAEHIYVNRFDNPVTAGSRNVVMFNLSRQLLNWKDLNAEEAWEIVCEVNAAAQPPLPVSELRRQFESARNGGYTSTGCDDPLMAGYVHPDCPIAGRR